MAPERLNEEQAGSASAALDADDRASSGGRRGAWGRRSFRLLFVGQGVSAIGDRVVNVALAFAVLDLTGSVKDLGIVLAAQAVPLVLFLLLGGVWSDRLSRRTVMIASDLVRAGTQGVSGVLLVTGAARIWQLVILQAAYGIAEAFFGPAAQALLPETVAKDDLQRANALMAISGNVANIGGPALAGILVVTIGAGWGLAVDACTFLVSAGSLALMRVAAAARAPADGTWVELRDGWRAFRSKTWLWASVLAFLVANGLAFGPMSVLGPEVARTSLSGPGAWAAINSLFGIGAVLGGVLGLRWQPRLPLRAMFTLSLVGPPTLLALLAAAAPLPALFVSAVVFGSCVTLVNLFWFTVVQHAIPSDELARVSSWDALGSYAINPIALAATGPIALSIGISTTLYIASALSLLVAAGALAVGPIRAFTYVPSASSGTPDARTA